MALISEADVVNKIGAKCEEAGGVASWARSISAPASTVQDALDGRRGPSPRILEVLGLRRVRAYERVGK